MELIVKVTSPGLRTPLADLLRLPLGLDVWEVKPDHLILRAAEPRSTVSPAWVTGWSRCRTWRLT